MSTKAIRVLKIVAHICISLALACFLIALTRPAWVFVGLALYLAGYITSMLKPKVIASMRSVRILYFISIFASFAVCLKPIVLVVIPLIMSFMLIAMLIISSPD